MTLPGKDGDTIPANNAYCDFFGKADDVENFAKDCVAKWWPLHYVHFVKYDDAVSFYDAVSDTIRRRGGNRGIFTEEGVDTVAYFGGNHGSRV